MKIIDSVEHCSGCTACAQSCPNHAIVMKENIEGFLYPSIMLDKCIECGKCQRACPIVNSPILNTQLKSLAVKSRNEVERLRSTSGGIFPLLAKYVLQNGGIVYGASYNENQIVEHIGIENIEDIHKLQGAKYSQSRLEDVFSSIKMQLDRGRTILFSGTPCQCAGLKSYLVKDYENLILVDLVCHGVPSPKVWEEYIKYRKDIDHQNETVVSINMRSKNSGWSRYSYSVLFEYSSGYKYSQINGKDPFMIAFVNNMILRKSCGHCHFKGVHRCSDFTLGDYWGIWNQKPEFDDNKGTSVVLLHSDKANRIWSVIKDKCDYFEVCEKDTYVENPSMLISSTEHGQRNTIMGKIGNNGFGVIGEEIEKILKDNNSLGPLKSIIRRVYNKVSNIKKNFN